MPSDPDQPEPPDADYGPNRDQIVADLLTLTWDFLVHASPAVQAELQRFLASRGWHPTAGMPAFLDALQFNLNPRHNPDDPPPA